MPKKINIKYSQSKEVKKSIEGKCQYCRKEVASMEAHIKAKHLGKKVPKK